MFCHVVVWFGEERTYMDFIFIKQNRTGKFSDFHNSVLMCTNNTASYI